eukprot:TRINITY_DN491_c0_g1_i1.p1 TRINITY_DN491_c0_g1~~TRINITY_DN491_c0_g1_i1.p1  ORF type:complete len:301 (-),score=164.08 TRINITY_DN491_c0_g1_i1:115-1017(-)
MPKDTKSNKSLKKTKNTKNSKKINKKPTKAIGKNTVRHKVRRAKLINLNVFSKVNRDFSVGNDIQPKRDLTRYVKWPRYIRLQRQKRILLQRLRVPPAINQFSKTLDKNLATQLFKFIGKYKPEERAAKIKRIKEEAKSRLKLANEAKKAGKKKNLVSTKKPKKNFASIKFGINNVTNLIERKKAKLVIIAHDVDPIEIVVWLPALCRKLGVPYVIVKGKSRVGAVIGKKTATALVVKDVREEDETEFATLLQAIKENYTEKIEGGLRQWGGCKLGQKATRIAKAKEDARRAATLTKRTD